MKIAIIYHSGYGHTKTLAEAVARGAQSVEGTEARLFFATDITPESTEAWEYLDAADAHIYGSPTYMGAISAGLKQVFEQKPAVERWMSGAWANKIGAGFSNSSSPSGDKLNTLVDLAIIGMQFGLIWVGLAEPPAGKDGGNTEDVNRLGAWLGAMAQSVGHDDPLPGDLKTGESLGKRVAEAAVRWNAAK
ncbi:MAG TPA: flavodoxin family protein [Abditibacterium sp.]|jgi:multimeric flavodoxin WrbA